MPAKVDICVLTHNSSEVTSRFLPHLIQNTAGVEYALHLLDNGSEDGGDNWRLMRRVYVASRMGLYRGLKVTIERSDENLNFAGGNNVLARKGSAPWILFINNDAFPLHRDWLAKMVATCENGGFLACGPVSDRVMGYQQVTLNGRMPEVHHMRILSGFCVLVERKAFEAVGGWDERFDNGDEDLDLSLAIRNYAWQRDRNPASLAVNRRVFVHHELSQSLGPWCAKQGKTIAQHFKNTHIKLVDKRGERVLLDAFFIEDVKHPPSKWRELGVLPNGTYHQQPSDPHSNASQFISHAAAEPSQVSELGRHRSGEGAHPPGNARPVRHRAGGAGIAPCAQAGAAGSAGRGRAQEGRGAVSGEDGRHSGHDSLDAGQGVPQVQESRGLLHAGNGRDDARTGRLAGDVQGREENGHGEAACRTQEPWRVASGLPSARHHIGFTADGGCVHRLERPGRECCFRGVKSIVRCSCESEAVA